MDKGLSYSYRAVDGLDVTHVLPEHRLMVPGRLYVAGDSSLLGDAYTRVAVIGTRTPTPDGVRRAQRVARELAKRGFVVVSGLAAGVDTAAHQAAIDAGGRTIAVLGVPIDKAYPKENVALQQRIATEHLAVSQFEPGKPTYPSFFVQRNRTMAVICHATIVIEAGDSSGTLSQAAETIRLGRQLFILPSALERKDLAWPQRFADKGAKVLNSIDLVCRDLVPA